MSTDKPTATFGSKKHYDAWIANRKLRGQNPEDWDIVKKYVEQEVNDLLDTYDELKIEDVLPVATEDEVRKGTNTSKPVSTWEDIQAGTDISKTPTPAGYRKGGKKKGVVVPNRKNS